MITNPMQIDPATIFLIGPPGKSPGISNEEFERTEALLTKKGAKVFNPEKNVHCKDIRTRIAFMVRCGTVITLPDWHNSEQCMNEVQVARVLGMPVEFSEKYIREELHAGAGTA